MASSRPDVMGAAGLERVFWPAAVRTKPFADHVEAAAAGGFTALAIAPETYAARDTTGFAANDMVALAADRGTPLRHLDTVTAWAPIRCPDWASAEARVRFDVSADEIFRMAHALELHSLLAVAGFEHGALSLTNLVDSFGVFCMRAAREGLHVELEFMPFLGVPDLTTAWAIVSGSGTGNAGVLVDTWHFARGANALSQLDDLPDEAVTGLQLADGWRESRAPDLFEDTLRFRRFPGEGELPLTAITRALLGKSGLRSIGVEVYSDEANTLSAGEVGRRCGTGMADVLAQSEPTKIDV